MPFQVVFHTFNVPPEVVSLVTAGEDQAAICTTTITMTATVSGDLTGHTVLWEQISGTTVGVTFITPTNQLSVTYTNTVPPGAFDDKVFRFYIDKSTVFEQSDDVTIFGTPTSITYVNNPGSGGSAALGNVLGDYTEVSPTGRSPVMFPLRFFPPTFIGSGGGGCTGIQLAVTWTEPELPRFLTRYIVQQLIGNMFVDIAFFQPTDPRVYFGVVLGGVYRVVAEFNNGQFGAGGGSFLSLHHSNAVFLTVDPRHESADIEGFSPSMASRACSSINNVKLTNYAVTFITVEVCDNFAAIPDANAGAFVGRDNSVKLTNYVVTLLTLKGCDNFAAIPDANDSAFVGRVNNVKLTNYVVQPLGGGSIGG